MLLLNGDYTIVKFKDRLRETPHKPGVYLMRNEKGEIIYVGKASDLRNRLSSYFINKNHETAKVRSLVKSISNFEFIITESEQEALILECNLIKENKPRFNSRLKDDKSYPFIKIDTSENFPQVYITRNVQKKSGVRYFGPFANAGSIRSTLSLIKKLFPYRSCTKDITGTDKRACLDFHINRCLGPCIGAVDKDRYLDTINEVILFLEGNTKKIIKSLSAKMKESADNLEFEKAAILRDQVAAIKKVHEGQKVLTLRTTDIDVIGCSSWSKEAWIEIFFIRQGKLIGRDHYLMTVGEEDSVNDVLTAFIKQFYDVSPFIPKTILTQFDFHDEKPIIESLLSERKQSKVTILNPKRGEKKNLLNMVIENATQGMDQLKISRFIEQDKNGEALEQIRESLNLSTKPHRIECYDISNIQGTNAVGSMVVFENGSPKNSAYRKFKIQTVDGVDDYSMMREMLTRRFKRLKDIDNDEAKNSSWTIKPDLVMIDGGKGHLGASLQVFLELGIDDIAISSLAKENEELFTPESPEPIILPRNSAGLYLVQRIRDEAHRFAITYHRQRRSKASLKSSIDSIPGIGPKRKKLLLTKFGSMQNIKTADENDIASVPTMTLKLAKQIKDFL